MRYLTIILLFISSLAMAQRPYLFPTIADAASNTYIGIGAYVQTQGYSASGDGGGALYRMTAIASAPMAADSGYVYPVTATKVLVQVLEDEYLRTATYGVVCGSSAQATNNFNRLQRFFTAINTLDKQAFVNGCNDTIYVNFTSALTTTLTSHDKFVMRGEGANVTRIKATAGSIDFGFSDAAKVNLFDLYLHGYDATAFGGIGGMDQALTLDSTASSFTLGVNGGNSVTFSKGGGGTDDQTISIDSTATSYTATVEDGGSITWAKVTDTDTDDQTLTIDSNATTYTLSIESGNNVKFAKSAGGGGTPGGNANDLQFNRAGSFTGTDSLEWQGANSLLYVNGEAQIGPNASTASLTVNAIAQNLTKEHLVRFSVSDNTTNYVGLFNNTNTNNSFAPSFYGYSDVSNGIPLTFIGVTDDTYDSATVPAMLFQGGEANSGDPESWNPNEIESRDIVWFRNWGTLLMAIEANGETGIGTADPGAKLHVIGNGTTTGSVFRLEDSGGADRFQVLDNGAVGIGTFTIDASALVDMTSTSRGLLPPRMTSTERDAISTPATGLTIFCTDCTATDASTGVMQTYNGTSWKNYW